MAPQHHPDRLHRIVAQRWDEIADFALRECADGYNRGYVVVSEEDDALAYVTVPDHQQAMSETTPPYNLEDAVIGRENCEDYIIVATETDKGLLWAQFGYVGGRSIREAAAAHAGRP